MFKSKKMKVLLALCLVFVMITAVGCGAKQDVPKEEPKEEAKKDEPQVTWPEKDITLIYHSKAGSGGDMFLRALAKALEPGFGKSVIVDNKPGAAGATAWKAALDAKDGHTFLGVSSTLITAPIMNKMDVDYKSFKPITMMFVDPMIMFVRSDAPWDTWEDFVQDAQANSGKFNIAGGIPGELGFVAAKLLQEQAEININVVPFEGGADATVAVLGGHVDGAIGEYGEAVAQLDAGELKALIAFNEVSGVDIPTVQDKGMDFLVEKFRGVVAHPDTPDAVVDQWVKACEEALKDPGFKQYYENLKLNIVWKPKAEFVKVMEEQDKQIRAFMN
ncbi:MAG: tripartite tricarboxylate transporter substrate binding protein [Peptococcaceae bacterium]